MKNIKLVLIWVMLLAGVMGTGSASAQSDVPAEIKMAIRNGSSRDLARYFNNTIEIGLDGEKSSYSKTQAEFVLKSFFTKNVPVGFEFDHQGSSNQGQRYAIGTYNSKGGPYRVFVVVKLANGTYLIDTIDFTKK